MQQSWFQVSDNLISSTLGGGASPQIHLHITRDSQEDLDEELDSRQQKIQNWTRKEVFVRKQFEKKNMAGTRIRNFDLTWPRFDPSPRSQGQIWLLLELQVVTQFIKKTSFVLTELKLGLTQGGLGAYPRGWFGLCQTISLYSAWASPDLKHERKSILAEKNVFFKISTILLSFRGRYYKTAVFRTARQLP